MKKKMKFLGTFASQSGVMSPMHKGVNDLVPFCTEWQLTSALASGETATITLPAGLDLAVGGASGQGKVGYVPIVMAVWSQADPQLPLWQPQTANSLLVTSYDRDTGTVILTAGSAGVANKAVIIIMWVQSTLGL